MQLSLLSGKPDLRHLSCRYQSLLPPLIVMFQPVICPYIYIINQNKQTNRHYFLKIYSHEILTTKTVSDDAWPAYRRCQHPLCTTTCS